MREKFMFNEADNKTPREFFRITSVVSRALYTEVSYDPTKILVRLALLWRTRGSPWYIARLEKWFRRRGNQETPKCSLRFGWRRIAFSPGARICIRLHIHGYVYSSAFVTRCTWLARVILVRFAGFWTNVLNAHICMKTVQTCGYLIFSIVIVANRNEITI